MLDFSQIFNIVFASVCAALILFLLISVIVVAAKGKRKCGAFDVILRILSTLVFIASIAMVAASVLSMLNTVDGSMCIVVAQVGDKATALFAFGGEIIELPLPELFVALSTVIGFGISALLFILSLTALIVDCLVANKKSDKKQKEAKKQKVQKTPEQLKREAELERIKRIGESAVRKTSSVASAEKSERVDAAANSEPETKSEPTAPEQAEPEQQQEEPDFDWRTEPKAEEQSTSFVGIKDEQDDFDSFDSFDAEPNESEDQPEKPEQAEEVQDDFDSFAEPEQDEQQVEENEEQEDFDLDNIVEQSEGEYVTADEEQEEQPYAEEQPEVYDEQNADEYDGEQTENTETEPEDQEQDDDMSAWQFEIDNAENAENSDAAEDADDTDEVDNTDERPVFDAAQEEKPQVKADKADFSSQLADSGIEPDRGIYIPKMRTVTRGAAGTPNQRPTPVRKPVAKPAAKPTAKPASKPAAQNPKPAAKKPAAKPKRGGGTGRTQKPVTSSIPPEKKLPVTRRYVILDRHNAVNMFGEYLKERNQAEKDKLKSSINTIIIE